MDKAAALRFLRSLALQKTAGGLTAPVAGAPAPKLPTVGEGGTKQDQLLRAAGQNAQAQSETVQNRVVPATSNYSPAKGRNVSGPSGIGQSVTTVLAKQPKDRKLIQPPTQAKMAHVKQAARRSSRGRVWAVLDEMASATPPQAGVPAPQMTPRVPSPTPVVVPPEPAAPQPTRPRASQLPVSPGVWRHGTRLPDLTEIARLREGVRRYSPYGSGDMSPKDMRTYLQGLNERPSAATARFSSIVGGPFLRYPSPPVYAPSPIGSTLAGALTHAGEAFGLKNKGGFRKVVESVRGAFPGAQDPSNLVAPAIEPGLLRNAAGEIAPLQATLRMGAPAVGLYSAYKGGKALYDYATNKSGDGSKPNQAGKITMELTPEQAKNLRDIEDADRRFDAVKSLSY